MAIHSLQDKGFLTRLAALTAQQDCFTHNLQLACMTFCVRDLIYSDNRNFILHFFISCRLNEPKLYVIIIK
jgi:hypothetical protein